MNIVKSFLKDILKKIKNFNKLFCFYFTTFTNLLTDSYPHVNTLQIFNNNAVLARALPSDRIKETLTTIICLKQYISAQTTPVLN